MTRFVAVRLAGIVPVLFGASVFSFALARLAPGDITTTLLGPYADPQDRAQLRRVLGLDQPLPLQYVHWLWHVLGGDLGTSIQLRAPVATVLFEKFQNTLILGGVTFVCAIVFGVIGGFLSAVRYGSAVDRIVQAGISTFAYVPVFWFGVVLIYVFSLRLHWLPSGGMGPLGSSGSVGDKLRYVLLPAIATAGVPAAIITRTARSTIYAQLHTDFVRTAKAKGLPQRVVLGRHVWRAALPSIVHVSGLQFAYLLTGSIVFTEVVFNWPGIGLQVYGAVTARDMPMIQGVVLLAALVTALTNVVVDVIHASVEPQLLEVAA